MTEKILSFIVILPTLKLNTFILVVLIGMTICDFVILFSESKGNSCFHITIVKKAETRVHSMAQKYKPGEEFHEIIISNYDMRERERSKPYQLNFFDTNQTREVNKIIKENVVYHGK